jgi:sucrose phosphorylase
VGRDINRHYYRRHEVLAALRRPVVMNLCALIRLRNTHTAFHGTFSVEPSTEAELALRWQNGAEFAELRIDFGADRYSFAVSAAGMRRELDLLALAESYALPPRGRTTTLPKATGEIRS